MRTPTEHTIFAALDTHVPASAPAGQLCVYHRGQIWLNAACGALDPDKAGRPVDVHTRFDLASLTKLFVVTGFMRLVERGDVGLDQPVVTCLPDFVGKRPVVPYEDPLQWGATVTVDPQGGTVDAGTVTFRQLLTHTSGLPAWRPLFREPSPAAAAQLARTTFFSYQPGAHIVYSDIGLILLGFAMEACTQLTLDTAVQTLVLVPSGATEIGYRAPIIGDDGTCAPTEFCAWRGRRVVGAVHDENAFRLDGVAGHAGLFGTAQDVARFGQIFLDGGAPILRHDTVAEMRRCHVEEDGVRRGLGFALWSPDPDASSNPFGPRTFGHTGFTGTSLWIDPDRDLVVALLTNEVYNGRAARRLIALRRDIHRTVVQAIDAIATRSNGEPQMSPLKKQKRATDGHR